MVAKKIIVIKLGAMGDVVRTICILPVLKKKYPDSEIYWITRKESVEIIEGNPYIKRIF
jgi:heptosyltransferase-2